MSTPIVPARPEHAADVSRLLREYLTVTEREKAERGLADRAPQRYQDEINHPERLLANCLLAHDRPGGEAVGLVVLKEEETQLEIKRLWVDPRARGTGAGRALVRAAIERAGDRRVTLTVWDWRQAPIGLYRSLGFTDSPSWDKRERLLCMTFQSSR